MTDTDAEPTPGGWMVGDSSKEMLFAGEGAILTKVEPGDYAILAEVNQYFDEWIDNARLIAAAGTSAHDLPDEYDPVETVRTEPDRIKALEHVKKAMESLRDNCDDGWVPLYAIKDLLRPINRTLQKARKDDE